MIAVSYYANANELQQGFDGGLISQRTDAVQIRTTKDAFVFFAVGSPPPASVGHRLNGYLRSAAPFPHRASYAGKVPLLWILFQMIVCGVFSMR